MAPPDTTYVMLMKRFLCAIIALAGPAIAIANCNQPFDSTVHLRGWSEGSGNERFVNEDTARLSGKQLSSLQPAWVFALPDTEAPRSQPAVTTNTVFIADAKQTVYALDRESGCERWRFDAGSMVRTAMRLVETNEGLLLSFGTMAAELFALEAGSGSLRWKTSLSTHPRAMISGSTAEYDGILYQGISSWEVAWAANPFYACCTFRGSVAAIDVQSGKVLWHSPTIPGEARVTKDRWLLPDHRGPSGAPVWSQPAIDPQRGLLYVGTGENYSSPATDTSDAILAFRLDNGELAWKKQFTASDAWNVACVSPVHHNCPEERGGDLDFGGPPILTTVDGRDYLLAGQKSAWVFAMDPDRDGELLWSVKLGAGGKAGGIHFGMSVHPELGLLYVPISDRDVGVLGDSSDGSPPRPALHAVDIRDGSVRWSVDAPGDCLANGKAIKGCYPGFSAPTSVAGDIVFAPSLDGVLHAFDAASGEALWQYDTRREFDAVNGTAQGGAFDLGGAYAAGGDLYISSGYGLVNQIPGNAFIVFRSNHADAERSGEESP